MSTAEIPKTQHAVQFFKNGGPEVIEFVEIATPTPKPDEILVKVEYAGVNFIDTYFRRGVYPTPDFPFTLGHEAAGTILALPTSKDILESEEFKARGFKVGSKVAAYTGGSFVEYKALPWVKVALLPDGVDTRAAAATLVQGLTAITFINESYKVQSGDVILVHAVAGGLGLQLAQLAALKGAHVIGTTSSAEKAEVAKKNGAKDVIIYTKENAVDRVNEITHGKGVAAIFDGVGKDTWEDNFKMIAGKGTIVSIGNASGVVPPFSPLKLTPKNLKVMRPTVANYVSTNEEFTHYTSTYLKLLASGKIRVDIHAEYPFSAEGVRQSQIDIAGRGTVGKLLIKIAA